ncbi:unnamed protein product [Knipowitschia caucasica]
MQSPDGEGVSPDQSLWSLIQDHVSPSELPQIHSAVGHELVDRYTEAYAEMEKWQRILQDYGTGTPFSGHNVPLPDPPAVKELVRAEVGMLLQTLRERAGRDGEELMSHYKPETVSYAVGHTGRSYSRLSQVDDHRSGSRGSTYSNQEVEAVKVNLNVDGIEQVVDRLKSLFTEECEALKQEIKELQRNIWTKTEQDLKPAEPTLGELKELRKAIQKDLVHYPVSYTPLREFKTSQRSGCGASHLPTVLSVLSTNRDHTLSPSTQPKTGPPPGRTYSSPKPPGISPSSKAHCLISKTSKNTPPQHHTRHLTPHRSPITHRDGFPSPGTCSNRTAASNPAINPQKNSPIHETHLASHENNKSAESNLSPQMERKQSLGHRSRNNNTASSTISPRRYESNKDDKSSDCTGERSPVPNGLQNMTPGCNLLTGIAKKSSKMSLDKCEMGIAKGEDKDMTPSGSGRCKEGVEVCTKTKGSFSDSPTAKLSGSRTYREKQERTETEYLNRFIQPVPPPRLK